MKIKVLLSVTLMALVTLVAGAQTSTITSTKEKSAAKINQTITPAVQKQNLNNSQMEAVKEELALAAAQTWLKQLGYDLTIDGVRNLKSLTATGGTIERAQALTTENMKNLQVLKNLETLELAQFGNDDWVANAAGLVKLRSFVMSPASNLTDRSAEVFANMPELVQLMIHGSKITDAGFAKLSGLKKLKNLGIQYAKIGDASMPIIAQNTELEILIMSFTNVTDAGLPYLYNLSKLKTLYIQSTIITPAAIAELRKKLPQCNITY